MSFQKVDKSGNPVLTIGDPILDLVSDDEARVIIGGEAIHLTPSSSPPVFAAEALVQSTCQVFLALWRRVSFSQQPAAKEISS